MVEGVSCSVWVADEGAIVAVLVGLAVGLRRQLMVSGGDCGSESCEEQRDGENEVENVDNGYSA